MSNPTTPFSWQMPTATDLVTDLPADFEVFGQAVATSMADLLGGTSGQILAKNSNTDMDFTWITNDVGDITAVTAGTGISGGGTSGAVTITNSMATEITAKADLIVGTGSATFDNLAVGTNGQVLTADSTVSPTGLKWATPTSGATYVGASVYKSADQTISTATQTIITWNNEDFDTDSIHDNSTNNGRFTIPTGKGGKYLIAAFIPSYHLSSNVQFYIDVFKNGSLLYSLMSPYMTGYLNQGPSASTVVNAAAADYFELRITQSSGGNATISGGIYNARASISYLGA